MKLNPQQLEAVKHKSGPLLIVAGAGTGKTTVITERIKYLVQNQHLDPNHILALTFTDSSATEMLQRLDVVMPLGYQEPWVSTFHSFGDRILRTEGLAIGLDPNYKILNTGQQWIFIRQHLYDFKLSYYRPLGNPTKFISALITFFSRAADETVSPPDILRFAQKHKQADLIEIAQAYATYQQLKIKYSVLDFGDLITKTIDLFHTRPALLKKYQTQFQHLLVDEFQDTNYAQYQLIKLLAPARTKPNLVVVGDDDQAIYKFRGAAISNILNFSADYPRAKKIVLIQNYRSLAPILEAAYSVITHNNPDRLEVKLKLNKKLVSVRQHPDAPPTAAALPTDTDETEWIIQKIIDLVSRENYTYKDFAILTRANSQLDPFVTALKRHGLPYQLIGNRGLFDQAEIKTLIYFLTVVVNPQDSVPLFQLLQDRIFGLDSAQVLKLLHQAKSTRVPLWEVLVSQPDDSLKAFVKLIKSAQDQSRTDPPTKILYSFLTATKFINQFVSEQTVENELTIKNINLFLRFIQKLETDLKPLTLAELVDYFTLLFEAGVNPAQAEIEDIDTIRLLTIHSAKGLEFPVVFIPSLVTGRFPAVNRRDPIEFPDALIKDILPQGDANLQEERRLFYVGLTRARDYLFLTHAQDYGGARARHPSGFIAETNLPTIEVGDTQQLSLLTADHPPLVTTIAHGKVDIKYLSYSQIDTFKVCPLKYKYRYILQIPAAPHYALSFGQSVHDTLRHFHQLELKGHRPTLKDLLFLYRQYFRDTGYDSPQHKQLYFDNGTRSLKDYFKVYKSKLGKPVELEKSFRLTIAGIPLIGKIDRLDKVGGHYEIVDYKTGQSQKTTKEVDKDEQLTIYALGAKYSLGVDVDKLSLYFLDSNEKISTTRSAADLDNYLKYLATQVKAIKSSDFPATPGYPAPCNFCEYNRICPFAAKRR